MGSSMGDTVRGAAEESATNLASLAMMVKNGEDGEIKQIEAKQKQLLPGPAPIPHSEMFSQETSGAATITNTPGVPQINAALNPKL